MKLFFLKLTTLSILTLLFTSCKENDELIETSTSKTELGGSFLHQKKASPVEEWFIDDVMKKNGETFKKAFNSIVSNKKFKEGDFIILGANFYRIDGKLLIEKKVNIIGKGQTKTILFQNKPSSSVMKNSVFIVCHAEGITFKNVTISADNKSNKAVIVNKRLVEFNNVRFLKAKWGIFSNFNIGSLKVLDCYFTKSITFRGIAFNSDISKENVKEMSQIRIERTVFEGKQPSVKGSPKFAISIDAGNEASNDNSRVIDMRGMLIEDCTFTDDFGGGIALAQVKNVNITDNDFFANKEQKRNAIHLEDTSSNINIVSNEFICNTSKEGKPLIFIGSSERTILEDGCKNIYIRGNIFEGKCQRLIQGERAQQINISHNKMCKMETFEGPKINFYNINDKIFIPTSGNNANKCVSYEVRDLNKKQIKFHK